MNRKMTKRESGSSQPARRPQAKRKPTTRSYERVVRADEVESSPRVRARVKRELAALASADRAIDLTDARELPAPAWKKPIRGTNAWLEAARADYYKPVKLAVSMRLDADVVDWLKQSGPGYQTRANRILREKMLTESTR